MKKNLLLRNKTIFQILVTNCFSGFVFLPMRNHLIACLVFCLVMVFLLRFLGLKIYFRSPSGLDQLFSYFRAHCENKKKIKKIDPLHASTQSLHCSAWPKLEAIRSQIKDWSHEINLFYDKKYKYKADENRKVLAPITGTNITIGKTWFTFPWHRDHSKYHPKVGEYSTGGVDKFV